MITRREFMAAALVAPVFPLGSAMAQGVKEKEQAKQADFLFVQTAKSMSFDKSTNKLTLDGISSTTLFFSDRPERIAGNMKTTAFVVQLRAHWARIAVRVAGSWIAASGLLMLGWSFHGS